jgi:ABC-2 type transport system ATP-binding protein
VITVEHLTKEFGSIRAVQDVTFTVPVGSTVGLLGPNGSGKTTIMRILTGFFPPTRGRAWVGGIEVGEDSLGARRKVGYLPESVALYPDMLVRQFLEFCADVRRLRGPHRRARLDGIRDDCRLADVWQRQIGMLSKGYRQRVGLAQALLHEPDVLVLDEPTVGLDPRQVVELRALIGGLRGRTTVLLSTHILSEVATTCDSVVILDRGRVIAENPAADLMHGPHAGTQVLVRVGGPAPAVQAALTALPGVERVVIDAESAGAATAFIVHTPATEEIRASIAALIVGRGWSLLEVRPLNPTLEDVFVRLVTHDRDEGH